MAELANLFMKLKIWMFLLFNKVNIKFQEQFGCYIQDVTFEKTLNYLYTPQDSSSLAVTRILFGLAMLFDIPDERGGAVMHKRWGDPTICHFPLIPFVRPVSMPYMALVYAGLWLGALGITLGYKYRLSATSFTLCYWYLFLIEKSYWNNHTYLFGLVALLLAFTEANCYWSLDVYFDSSKLKRTVPYWNYFILKYQFFILYFMAGMKKGTAEWLTGYSVQNLSEHWVFAPFKLFLTVPQTDYLIVHWFVFAFDLTVAIWMMWSRTRHIAMVFCALFHLMNSRLFRIGMFPWVCLATMPLFYPFDWPQIVINIVQKPIMIIKGGLCKYLYQYRLNNISAHRSTKQFIPESDQSDQSEVYPSDNENKEKHKEDLTENNSSKPDSNKDGNSDYVGKELPKDNEERSEKKRECEGRKLTFALILFHLISQAFLPYSHFITKGYNNWTKGLYGYSWDMMIHTWDLSSVVVKVVDNTKHEEFYIDPNVYTPNDRWTRHGDMVHQYAICLKENLVDHIRQKGWESSNKIISENISIYVDVWCSMNGRFTQRMFDPKVDLLNASWSPFQPVSYLMPLLDEALDWRITLHEMKIEVHSWNNYSDVIFLADFPGYNQEKYLPTELTNVTLTILNGTVAYEPEITRALREHSYKLTTGNRVKLQSGTFHKVFNIGQTPAFYMYTFTNSSEATNDIAPRPKLPIGRELLRRMKNMIIFLRILVVNLFQVFFQLKHCY